MYFPQCINKENLEDIKKCVEELSASIKNDILNLRDQYGKTVIHQAVITKNLAILNYLLLERGGM